MNRVRILYVLVRFPFLVLWLGVFCRAQASPQGQWSALENWPTRAIHTTLLPDGRVFFFSYYNESLAPNIWDPATNTFSPTAPAPYALFCAGHTTLADGRVFIAGGHIADYTGYSHAVIYDPFRNTMTQVPDMNEGRWYPTTTVLANGDVLVVSGDVNSNTVVDPLPQVFQVATGTWRNLTSAQLMQALYPVMLVAPNVKVVYAGPEPQSRYLVTSGSGAWSPLALRKFSGWRDYGPGVMYDVGKILEVGGGDPPTATAETIDLTAATPTWNLVGSMHYARRQENAVILPDGKVFIVGGSSGSGFDDSTHPVLPTEMWNPATGQFTLMASIAVYRGYHSTALLLPDGRVMTYGNNPGDGSYNEKISIYSPPYLFHGARPQIKSVASPTAWHYGKSYNLKTNQKIVSAELIRPAAVTHQSDPNQRYVALSISGNGTSVGLNVTSNHNMAPPGWYMLFVNNANGVPSVAKWIHLS